MDTDIKMAAQQTKENIEDMVDQAEDKLSAATGSAKEDLNQLADETKQTLGKSVDGAKAQIDTAIEGSKEAVSQSKQAVQASINNPEGLIDRETKAKAADVKEKIEDTAATTKSQVKTSIEQAKNAPSETWKGVTRQMSDAGETEQADPEALKRRLDWGEPALTIVDVRHRESFNQERIRGAISMPESDLVEIASSSLSAEREIFVYGDTITQAEQAANSLTQAGFSRVASIGGGIPGWKSMGGATEGIAA